MSGIETEVLPRPTMGHVDLALTISEQTDTTRVRCTYREELFDAAQIHEWLGELRQLLSSVVANPAAPVDG